MKGRIYAVECRKCGEVKDVNTDKEAKEFFKNHKCGRRLTNEEIKLLGKGYSK